MHADRCARSCIGSGTRVAQSRRAAEVNNDANMIVYEGKNRDAQGHSEGSPVYAVECDKTMT
jgi:hypothetical protein